MTTTQGADLGSAITQARTTQGQGVSAGELIHSMQAEFAKVLPETIPASTFARLALTELKRTPTLQSVSGGSLLGALMLAAQLGLEPGGALGHLYLTPRKVQGAMTCVPIIGYKGLVELARRSGKVGAVKAQIVRDGDYFDEGFDTTKGGEYTVWRPLDHASTREAIGVLAWATLTTGDVQTRFTGIDEVMKRRDRGAAGNRGPWATDTDAMIRKSGIRALAADLPQSSAFALAQRTDERVTEYRAGAGLVDVESGEVVSETGDES